MQYILNEQQYNEYHKLKASMSDHSKNYVLHFRLHKGEYTEYGKLIKTDEAVNELIEANQILTKRLTEIRSTWWFKLFSRWK